MRKALISACIILAASIAVFLLGWIQLAVPKGSYAVILTKSHGWEEKPVCPGGFDWSWKRLLPTNMSIFAFSLKPRTESISMSGEMPQAKLYSSFLSEAPDFGYSFQGSVDLRVRPSSLPSVVRESSARDDASMDSWLSGNAKRVSSRLSQIIQSRSGDVEYRSLLSRGGPDLERELEREIAGEFPDLEIRSLSFDSFSFPDVKLYEQGKSMYAAFLAAKKSRLDPVIEELAESSARDEYRLESLERYGELLTKYPILIEYLAIEHGSTEALSIIRKKD